MPAHACHPCRRPVRAGLGRHLGFTLIELVMVMVMLGVLAVFAAPRLLSGSDTSARGFHDGTLSTLRYAQKTAIAQRRTVCVAFTSTSVSLRIALNAGVYDCAGANGLVLNGPDGKSPFTVSGASFTAATVGSLSCLASPAAFNFDALGQPVNNSGTPTATAQCMRVANAANTSAVEVATITVEAATGYVHE